MSRENDYSVLIGLDWARAKHDVCLQYADGTREFAVVKHSAEAIEQWIVQLHKVHQGQIAVALELSKGPIVYALQKYAFVTLFPINPTMLCRYRRALSPSCAKDDPTDAFIALELLIRYPDKITPLKMSDTKIRKLAFLVEERRRLVDEKKRYANRLINTLHQYYPQPLEWFSHRDSELFMEFIIRWPTLEKLKRAKPETVSRFLTSRGSFAKLVAPRLEAIKKAKSLTNDEVVIESNSLLAITLANQIRPIIAAIRTFDQKIETLFHTMPDARIYESLPGVGKCLGPRLLVAFGEDRGRFESAQEVQKYAGIAPVTERSGKTTWVHWRWGCSKFIRQTFIEWSAKTVRYSYWAQLYYEQQRKKGNTHQRAVRSLAFKWIRVLYCCWKSKTPYDETKYLKVLKERNSPLLG
ncbi:IS110 family RNA-guided transposase [Salinimonas chungwhensis]|uniref:IS110 family transposase n=1 Tax=Salinimonas chungwhensis TaxID=265425 RepID=UPI00037490A9|nr:IS110 family transposase [Salinimonas chungwhensis]